MVTKPYQAVKDALVSFPCLFPNHTGTDGTTQATGTAVPSVAASMIAGLCEKPSYEDELASKAVPATMYIGEFLRLSLI